MKEKRIFKRFGFNLFKAENPLPKSKVITEFENWIYELNANDRIYIYRGGDILPSISSNGIILFTRKKCA
ncbi:hypothetical protein [Apibacter mensalis]|uniref:hypothetical protein n=1 Tax=Apibacter mensalis TaxID=1586267 RepID=UPI0026ECD783|nr:hypothetical protein [Apibacter mensalis]